MTQPPSTPSVSSRDPSDWEPVEWEPAGWEPDSDAVEAAVAQHLGSDAEDIHAAVRQAQEQADLIADPHARSIEPEIPAPDVSDDIGLNAPVAQKVSVQDVVQAAAAEVDQEIVHDAHHGDAEPSPDAEPASDAGEAESATPTQHSSEDSAPSDIWNAPSPPGGNEQRAPGAS